MEQVVTGNKVLTKQVFIKLERWGYMYGVGAHLSHSGASDAACHIHLLFITLKWNPLLLIKLWQKARCKKIWCKWQNSLNIQRKKKSKNVLSCYIISVTLAIQKVCSHEQFQCDLRSDGEFRNFCGAVGVTDLVGEVHADLGQDVRRDLPEVHFVGFILSKLTCRWKVTAGVTSRND